MAIPKVNKDRFIGLTKINFVDLIKSYGKKISKSIISDGSKKGNLIM